MFLQVQYWSATADIVIRNRIHKEISLEIFKSSGRKEKEWIQTEEVQELNPSFKFTRIVEPSVS
jgi:hypothetical protein